MRQNASLQGQAAETRAEGWLIGQGLQTLDRNWHCREGELDLVMLDGDTLCFVEVKYRHYGSMVDAAACVDFRKQQRLIKAAARWLGAHEPRAELPCRFDVVTVSPHKPDSDDTSWSNTGSHYHYRWIKDAFSSE